MDNQKMNEKERRLQLDMELAAIINQLRAYMKLLGRKHSDWIANISRNAVSQALGERADLPTYPIKHSLGEFTVVLRASGYISAVGPSGRRLIWSEPAEWGIGHIDTSVVMDRIKPLLDKALVLETLADI